MLFDYVSEKEMAWKVTILVLKKKKKKYKQISNIRHEYYFRRKSFSTKSKNVIQKIRFWIDHLPRTFRSSIPAQFTFLF